jgi:hypothetical protein
MHEQHRRALAADYAVYGGSRGFDLERFESFREEIRGRRGSLLCLRFAQASCGDSGDEGRGGLKEFSPPDAGSLQWF